MLARAITPKTLKTKQNKMKKSDLKVLSAIKASELWLELNKTYQGKKLEQFSETGGLTITGCEMRNLEEFKKMLGKDKRKLTDWQRRLYLAI